MLSSTPESLCAMPKSNWVEPPAKMIWKSEECRGQVLNSLDSNISIRWELRQMSLPIALCSDTTKRLCWIQQLQNSWRRSRLANYFVCWVSFLLWSPRRTKLSFQLWGTCWLRPAGEELTTRTYLCLCSWFVESTQTATLVTRLPSTSAMQHQACLTSLNKLQKSHWLWLKWGPWIQTISGIQTNLKGSSFVRSSGSCTTTRFRVRRSSTKRSKSKSSPCSVLRFSATPGILLTPREIKFCGKCSSIVKSDPPTKSL